MEKIIKWISEERNNGTKWETIFLANQPNEIELNKFLQSANMFHHWPLLSVEKWYDIVKKEQKKEDAIQTLIDEKGASIIGWKNENNTLNIPTDENSAWQTYKRHLLRKNFNTTSVTLIEDATIKTLRCLSRETRIIGAIKGMIVGNVQSGKTANMAALIAMAADYGWNMFIVLSGMMENLRRQTQRRLLSDLTSVH